MIERLSTDLAVFRHEVLPGGVLTDMRWMTVVEKINELVDIVNMLHDPTGRVPSSEDSHVG